MIYRPYSERRKCEARKKNTMKINMPSCDLCNMSFDSENFWNSHNLNQNTIICKVWQK